MTQFTFLKRKTALFWLKRPPKSSPFEKNLQFDLLDHQEDTQGAVLSHNHCRINHITMSFIVILAKNVKIYRKLSLLWPLGCLWGSEQKNFLWIMIQLIKMYLFCDKTLVVRPTSNPQKLKFVKICQKSAKYPPGSLFWGPSWPKKIFYKMFQLININIFRDKTFALYSKIKKVKTIFGCFWPFKCEVIFLRNSRIFTQESPPLVEKIRMGLGPGGVCNTPWCISLANVRIT